MDSGNRLVAGSSDFRRRSSTALSPLPTARCPARALPFSDLFGNDLSRTGRSCRRGGAICGSHHLPILRARACGMRHAACGLRLPHRCSARLTSARRDLGVDPSCLRCIGNGDLRSSRPLCRWERRRYPRGRCALVPGTSPVVLRPKIHRIPEKATPAQGSGLWAVATTLTSCASESGGPAASRLPLSTGHRWISRGPRHASWAGAPRMARELPNLPRRSHCQVDRIARLTSAWRPLEAAICLTSAKLVRCIARQAQFGGCVLASADLRGGCFAGAGFQSADLRDADLRDADLRGADFTGAIVTGAKLNGAQLDGATLNPS